MTPLVTNLLEYLKYIWEICANTLLDITIVLYYMLYLLHLKIY